MTLKEDANKVFQITKNFIESIKERITLEEEVIFSTAEMYCIDGVFEV